jgi:hypothetical protein
VKSKNTIKKEEGLKRMELWIEGYNPERKTKEGDSTVGKTSGTTSFIEPDTPIRRLKMD